SLDDMRRLIEKDPRNQERIFPYIGGEEVNESPTHAHHRYVINFGDMPLKRDPSIEERWVMADADRCREWLRSGIVPTDYPDSVAADWPLLLETVDGKVKSERARQKDGGGKTF